MLKAAIDHSAEKLWFQDEISEAGRMDTHVVTPGLIDGKERQTPGNRRRWESRFTCLLRKTMTVMIMHTMAMTKMRPSLIKTQSNADSAPAIGL
jgi:hypothetical protein